MAKSKRMRKKRKKRNVFLRILLALLFVVCICALAVVGVVVGSLAGYVEDTELVDVDNMRLNLTSFVYAQDSETGEMVELQQLYDTENRVWVSGSKIPDNMKNAFISIEDERFYRHHGFDIKRLAGATYQYITNKGNSSYGGSTITQQLVKNITRDDEYSVKRKIQELYRSYKLENELSKDEILEYYLNTIFLSQNCNGVQSASQVYFGKNVWDLSLAECASIAGITKSPTKYDPVINPENNEKRRLVILKKMYQLGYITKSEYTKAKQEKITLKRKKDQKKEKIQSYYIDATIDQVIEDLMTEYNYKKDYATKLLYNGGLKIYLAIDQEMQAKLDKVFNDNSTFQRSSRSVQPQSSMVIIDPYTGYVRALTGGRGEKGANRTLNRATQTKRQPGSTIKPLSVYSPAIEYGLVTPSSIVNDSPVKFGEWAPRNDDRRFAGRITVRSALRGSRNVPAVKICEYLTTDAAFDFVTKNYNVSGLLEGRLQGGKKYSDKGLASIALGGLTEGVSVLDMTAAYACFPNGGTYIKPSMYSKVIDSEGNVILEHSEKGRIAISETTARDMVSMMTDVVTGGTGTSAKISGMNCAGKTGTTSSNNDRWFVGYTPYYVAGVWFGYDQPYSLKGFSSNPAAIAWRKVMTEVHKGLPNKSFFDWSDDDTRTVLICKDSGMRATPACNHLTSKTVSKDNVPEKYCTEHRYKFNANNLLKGAAVKHDDDDTESSSDDEKHGEAENEDLPDTDSGSQSSSGSQSGSGSQPSSGTTHQQAPESSGSDGMGIILE